MIGKKLSHFVIEEKLGEGGMGVVYKARDEKLGRHVALKVLQPDAVGKEERQLRFLREARAAAAVTHPNIAAVYEIDEAEADDFPRRALEMDPRREVQTLRAWILIAGGLDIGRGIELAREALDLRPPPCVDDYANLYMPLTEHALGLGYLEQGKKSDAKPLLERAAELRPGDAAIREHLARASR